MPTGKLVFFDSYKLGYGFVACDDGSGDIFLHKSEVRPSDIDQLRPGLRISYILGRGKGGRPCARDIRVIDPDAVSSSVSWRDDI